MPNTVRLSEPQKSLNISIMSYVMNENYTNTAKCDEIINIFDHQFISRMSNDIHPELNMDGRSGCPYGGAESFN